MSTYLFGCTIEEIDSEDSLVQISFIQEEGVVEAYEQTFASFGDDSYYFEEHLLEMIGGNLTPLDLFNQSTTVVICVNNEEQRGALLDILGDGTESHFININIVNFEENYWLLNTALIPLFEKVKVIYDGYHDGELLGQMHDALYNAAFLAQQYEQVIYDRYGVSCLIEECRVKTANPANSPYVT